MRGAWARVVAYSGDSRFADKATALARYDRAVGLDALVNGLEASKAAIASKVLADPNISIYQGGRSDIVFNKVDVRVLAMIAYLRESFGSVTVSCLISGHRLYARPGVISAHIYGRAVDISAVGGVPIQGHQQPGGITERAVRAILLLPDDAATGHLTARARRTIVPAGRPLQPHPRRVLVEVSRASSRKRKHRV
jgi:hypothetical protein